MPASTVNLRELQAPIKARYLVDGTGYKSVVADRYGLRENPTRLKHHSRTLFTHMVDVPPFEEGRGRRDHLPE